MTSNIVRRFRPVPVSLLPFDFDAGIYDGIIATIRRQGFLDALGRDLVPARQDHGNAYEFHVKAAARARKRKAREAEWRGRSAERAEAAEEARRRVRMLEAVERDRTLILRHGFPSVLKTACSGGAAIARPRGMIEPPPWFERRHGA